MPLYFCKKTMKFKYDVLVIGGGHAGCEAATAAANMGANTCLVTMDMNKIGQMSCNPAVGGIAKGQIVREIDALGGYMGLVTDATAIQFRMLNRSKGPAVWSPRAQCDRGKFIWEWRTILDHTDNLDIFQDQADELLVENGKVLGIKTIWGIDIYARTVVITAGTFLNGLMHIGKRKVEGGRCAEPAVHNFTESITRHGIRADRMKTGTPVRIDRRSERPTIISSLSMVRIVIYHSCLAGRVTRTRKRMRFFSVEWLTLPYSMGRFRVQDHAIVLRLKRNSSPSLTRIAILSSSNQRA